VRLDFSVSQIYTPLTFITFVYRLFLSVCLIASVIRDRPKPVFLVSAVAESGAVIEVHLWP